MVNLLAVCRYANGIEIKRVRTTQPVQAILEGIFNDQAVEFFNGVDDEIDFRGDWMPDPNELLVVDVPQNAQAIIDSATLNVSSLVDIDAHNFMNERIAALFIHELAPDGSLRRVLIQSFSAQQILSRKHALLLDGNTFKQLTEPAFSLSNKLVAIIEGGKIKFKSFNNLKKIFDIVHLYTEATDAEIDAFCQHDRVVVADPVALKSSADQIMRKLIHSIHNNDILSRHEADAISAKAAAVGLDIEVRDGKIVLPTDKAKLKLVFRFLDDALYEGPLSELRYQANSKRLVS
ncbi:Kiwa anti-phage protein KwaB-like domain-containing protein [Xanthobacter autotrophicus]|uniref:Kiwa anti-phage protein KwaB-like domain-containing protein n=1 Tax=Xanthobacter autotrophicus TaxID=280 RepID=UPI00372C7AF2